MSLVTPAKIDVAAAKELHDLASKARDEVATLVEQVGPAVAEVRRVLDLSQATVATNSGLVLSRYQAIERGTDPDIAELVALTDWMHRAAQSDEQALKPPAKPEKPAEQPVKGARTAKGTGQPMTEIEGDTLPEGDGTGEALPPVDNQRPALPTAT